MNNRNVFSFLFTLVISFVLLNVNIKAQNFEGEVTMKIKSGGETQNIDYKIKDGKIRMEVGEAMGGAMIVDPKVDKMIMIMPSQKMYMEYNFQKMDPDYDEDKTDKLENIERTGETKDINGYTAEKWVYKDDEGTVEAWMTDELGNFVFFHNPVGADEFEKEWQSKFEGAGSFPLLIINYDKSGNENTRMEVTNVEPKSLSADLFTPPADYQKMEMPSINMNKMMDQMKKK